MQIFFNIGMVILAVLIFAAAVILWPDIQWRFYRWSEFKKRARANGFGERRRFGVK